MQESLPLALARDLAQAALDAAAAKGHRVTVTIVDRAGLTKLVMSADGAPALSIETSRRKAYTAAVSGYTSGDLGKALAARPEMKPLFELDPQLFPMDGGLPIEVGGETVGGIGVGGAKAGFDLTAAQAAIDTLKAR